MRVHLQGQIPAVLWYRLPRCATYSEPSPDLTVTGMQDTSHESTCRFSTFQKPVLLRGVNPPAAVGVSLEE